MPVLLIRSDTGEQQIEVAHGQSVRDVLDATALRVRAACGGTGTCGACVIKLIDGDVTPPTVAEYMKLSAAERDAGTRLACQLRLRGDARILLDQPAPPSKWKSIPPENLCDPQSSRPDLNAHVYGVAVDLGTTHIRVALWDRRHGRRIATRLGPNPQSAFGADVLNRLAAANNTPEHAAQLARLARTAIVQAVRDMLARDVGEVTPMLAEIGAVMIVGNTAMLTLLTGCGSDTLLDPARWQSRIDFSPQQPEAFQPLWFMPNAAIQMPAPVAGFIGSDLVADLIATRLADSPPGALLIDVGTNIELALWNGETLHVTSVPGGPAFEGVGICHGMPAEPGAICRVRQDAGGFKLETIAGSAARGFCGSGLADAVASLLNAGVLKPSGRFAAPPAAEGYRLVPENPHTAITGIDVDAFQRAKAALATGMEILLRETGMRWEQVRRICICGAFGHTLDIAHAQAVGLLPPVDPSRFELFADASLAGCEAALLSPRGEKWFSGLTERCKTINLSYVPDYDDRYIDHLRLRPIKLDS